MSTIIDKVALLRMGLPKRNGGALVPSRVWDRLAKEERKLVEVYLTTGDEVFALEQAGYTYSDRFRLFHDERITSAIFYELTHRVARGAVIAQCILEKCALDENQRMSHRIEAAKALRAPFIDHKLQQQGLDKPLTEHTIEELRALVEMLEDKRSKDAKPVIELETAPVEEPFSGNPLDLLG